MNNYKPVIGLEIHVELKTQSGMFCQCKINQFKSLPNSHVCPVCLGFPGALPVPNKRAIEWTIKIGKALNCIISKHSKFDRKHYSYPDLAKGYQISQYDEPIATQGLLKLKTQMSNVKTAVFEKQFRINRVHLEEDTGKLIHEGDDTLIDFNRSGTPLVEIVTEPDFDNSDDVKRFLEELQVIIRYLGVSDADMERGSMRLEPNISLMKEETWNMKQKTLPNYKVEVKNINSFRFVKQAIEYELKRQQEILERGETPKQETRGFDSKKQITYSQRSKEQAHDYRYFPEPDIPPMTFSQEYIDRIKVPELPSEKVERYMKDYGLKQEDAFRITRDIKVAQYFDSLISNFQFPISKQISNFKEPISKIAQSVANLIINKKISTNLTIEQFSDKVLELLQPKETDTKLLESTIIRIIELNPKVVEDYKKGKTNAIMFLVGQVMREMKGKAEAKEVMSKLKSQMSNPYLKS